MKKYITLILIIVSIFLILVSISIINPQKESIPKLYLYGNITKLENKNDKENFKVRYESQNKNFNSYATIKLQGASSLQYPKKNFNITFYDENFQNKEYIDIKWGNINKYTLKANWIDNTYSRNIVTAKIYSRIQDKNKLFLNDINNGVVDGFPIELYINDNFYGLYTLNIHKDNLFNLDENNPNHLLFVGKTATSVTNFRMQEKNINDNFELEIGPENNESLNKLNRLINFVNESTDEEFVKHFDEYLDLDATINYYCYMMFAALVDNADNNLLLVTYDGKKWYPSLYDLDISWGISKTGETIPYDYDMNLARERSKLWRKLEKNFSKEIIIRYSELRKDILTKENVLNEFNKYQKSLPNNIIKKDMKQWQIEGNNNYKQIADFLEERIPYIDKEIEKLKNNA